MQDRHAQIIYEDHSTRAKEVTDWRHAMDETEFKKYNHWFFRLIPLFIGPLVYGGFCYYFLGNGVLKMFFHGFIPIMIILIFLMITKIYEWFMYGFHKKILRKFFNNQSSE